jgi:hypothetical protein
MTARERYNQLVTDRRQFLDKAVDCSKLTLPYLIQDDTSSRPTHETLNIPWQSVGSKCVVGLAAKLMLAILPPQSTFFKLQVREDKLGEELPPEARSEMELALSKMERMVMDYVAASNDRVVIHQALKHLIVGGNALLFMGKDGIKNYPLNRYVVNRDGNGNVLEIVTKELISRDVLGYDLPVKTPNTGIDETNVGTNTDDVEVYTCVKLENGRWVWYQEVEDMIIPGSRSTAPKNASPWLVLTFNSVDGEQYGRGRVEEFLGDLKSLEGLSQALVEGAAAASKVIFLVSPSSTTKPATIAKAGNGAIVQGRAEDVQVVQVGKTADFSTAAQMSQTIERRLLEAFLVMNIRNAERVTAEEVRLTQLELEQQLGGIFSLLTVSFLIPYLDRTLLVLQRTGELPKLPKEIIRPSIVAGVNALGRGQDRESLTMFMQTIAQTVGPEAAMQFINPLEAIKRLAAAQGIDVLNLVKTPQQLQGEKEEMMQNQQNQTLLQQAGQFANSKLADSENLQGMMPQDQQPPQP